MGELTVRLVAVCAACRRASCWQGAFYCEHYKNADVIEVPIEVLQREARESPHYWEEKKEESSG